VAAYTLAVFDATPFIDLVPRRPFTQQAPPSTAGLSLSRLRPASFRLERQEQFGHAVIDIHPVPEAGVLFPGS